MKDRRIERRNTFPFATAEDGNKDPPATTEDQNKIPSDSDRLQLKLKSKDEGLKFLIKIEKQLQINPSISRYFLKHSQTKPKKTIKLIQAKGGS